MPRELPSTRSENVVRGRPHTCVAYSTALGRMYLGESRALLSGEALKRFSGKVNLIFTSPPFPLNAKKKYGNMQGEEYLNWLSRFGSLLTSYLRPNGSIVMEVGNSWEKGRPVMSTLPTRSLLAFLEASGLNLCQEFVWSNPAKLPSPASWVTVKRIRVKDSFTKIWWMAPTEHPHANNRAILQPYSESMNRLLKNQKYNSGRRPSEHNLSESSFLKNNNGSIPGSVLTYSNTTSNDTYLRFCRDQGLTPHPARMPVELANFFIKFLTKPGDLVLDPFGGSNITGQASENLSRQWISIETEEEYVRSSIGRFDNVKIGPALES